MTIPDFQSCMRPLLELIADGGTYRTPEVLPVLAEQFRLTPDERQQLLPSGRQGLFENRVNWAKSHLKHAGLIEQPARALFRITERGRTAVASGAERIDLRYLSQFPEFREFRSPSKQAETPAVLRPGTHELEHTPVETLESTWKSLEEQTSIELLQRVKQCSPAFFERLVVDLLLSMGYGGSRLDAGKSIGRSGDGGIDGTINEDKLGLDTVYIQAKRWENPVGRPVVQGFAGSLEGERARKGVLITTSSFTREAQEYVARIEKRIVLINGAALAAFMLEHGVGVAVDRTYTLHRIDSDYFEDE